MKVLIIEGSALPALAIVRSLSRQGITALTADVTRINGAAWSRYSSQNLVHEAPSFSGQQEKNFVEDVLSLARNNGVNVLFPVNDTTVVPISKYKDRFLEYGIKVPAPPFEKVEMAYDKSKTHDFCSKLGMSQPKTALLSDVDDIEGEFGLPCVIKNRSEAVGGRSVRYARNQEELGNYLNNIKEKSDYLIQELIPGGSNVYSVVTVFDKGVLKASLTLKKIREFLPSGGVCVFGITVDEPEIQEFGVKLLRELKWHGTATVEIILDPRDNTPKLMEINPRFLGYVQLAIAAGVDVPYLVYKVATGENVEPVMNYKVGVTWLRPYDDTFGLMIALKNSESGHERRKLISSFVKSYLSLNTNSEYMQLSDPLPIFGQVLHQFFMQPLKRRLVK